MENEEFIALKLLILYQRFTAIMGQCTLQLRSKAANFLSESFHFKRSTVPFPSGFDPSALTTISISRQAANMRVNEANPPDSCDFRKSGLLERSPAPIS